MCVSVCCGGRRGKQSSRQTLSRSPGGPPTLLQPRGISESCGAAPGVPSGRAGKGSRGRTSPRGVLPPARACRYLLEELQTVGVVVVGEEEHAGLRALVPVPLAQPGEACVALLGSARQPGPLVAPGRGDVQVSAGQPRARQEAAHQLAARRRVLHQDPVQLRHLAERVGQAGQLGQRGGHRAVGIVGLDQRLGGLGPFTGLVVLGQPLAQQVDLPLQAFQPRLRIQQQAVRPRRALLLRIGEMLLEVVGQVAQLGLPGQARAALEGVQG